MNALSLMIRDLASRKGVAFHLVFEQVATSVFFLFDLLEFKFSQREFKHFTLLRRQSCCIGHTLIFAATMIADAMIIF
jgi:hypothetical protein